MGKKKNKTRNIIITVVIVIALIFLAIFAFNQATQTGLPEDAELLTYCSTETECISYLTNQGMPNNYLESNSITINCENGKCYAQK